MCFHTAILYCKAEVPHPQKAARLLKQICQKLHLSPISEPHITYYPFPRHAYLIILPIGQSHLSLETWPEINTVRILIDSCKEIDLDHLQEVVSEKLNTKDLKLEKVTTEWL